MTSASPSHVADQVVRVWHRESGSQVMNISDARHALTFPDEWRDRPFDGQSDEPQTKFAREIGFGQPKED